jgi:hypothetical protein
MWVVRLQTCVGVMKWKNLSGSKNVASFFVFGMILFWASSKKSQNHKSKRNLGHIVYILTKSSDHFSNKGESTSFYNMLQILQTF